MEAELGQEGTRVGRSRRLVGGRESRRIGDPGLGNPRSGARRLESRDDADAACVERVISKHGPCGVSGGGGLC